jgi:hypothetical protein
MLHSFFDLMSRYVLSHIQGSPFLNNRVTAGDPAYAPNVIAWSQYGIGLSPQEPDELAKNIAGVPQHFLVQVYHT